MVKTLVTEERVQSRREEIANSVSSGVGLVAIICGIPFLLGSAAQHESQFRLAGASIFAATMVSLYLSSTIYHALPRTKIKRLFRLFDHSAIFLLIAGTTHCLLSEYCVASGAGHFLAWYGAWLS